MFPIGNRLTTMVEVLDNGKVIFLLAPIVREAKVFGLLNLDDGAFTHEFSEKRRLRRVGDGASVD